MEGRRSRAIKRVIKGSKQEVAMEAGREGEPTMTGKGGKGKRMWDWK